MNSAVKHGGGSIMIQGNFSSDGIAFFLFLIFYFFLTKWKNMSCSKFVSFGQKPWTVWKLKGEISYFSASQWVQPNINKRLTLPEVNLARTKLHVKFLRSQQVVDNPIDVENGKRKRIRKKNPQIITDGTFHPLSYFTCLPLIVFGFFKEITMIIYHRYICLELRLWSDSCMLKSKGDSQVNRTQYTSINCIVMVFVRCVREFVFLCVCMKTQGAQLTKPRAGTLAGPARRRPSSQLHLWQASYLLLNDIRCFPSVCCKIDFPDMFEISPEP